MKILTLRRFVPENTVSTYGVLIYEKQPIAVTLELPDKNNEPNTSCIPTGEYICKPYSSEKYPNTWEVTNVPNRTYILIHKANFLRDIKGCIAIASEFDDINNDGVVDIMYSVKGFNKFMKIVDGEQEFKLVIEQAGSWVI